MTDEASPSSEQSAPSKVQLVSLTPYQLSVLSTEKLLLSVFVFFIMLTIFLIAFQSNWYYLTFVLSIVLLIVTYREGLVAMDE